MEIKEIYKGFKNYIFKNEEIEEIAERRLKTCFDCNTRTGVICDPKKGGCGCFIKAKARSGSKCPKNKW